MRVCVKGKIKKFLFLNLTPDVDEYQDQNLDIDLSLSFLNLALYLKKNIVVPASILVMMP